jgi:Protein of unknown function (DUF2804)
MLELDHLVAAGQGGRQYGRFAARFDCVNPLDEYAGVTRSLRRLRLKEWVGFTLLHPELYSSMIIQDANFLASSEIYAYPAAVGRLFQHAANAKGGSLRMPERLLGSHPVFSKPGYRLEYSFDEDGKSARIFGDVSATEKAPAFRVDLMLHGDRVSAPLSVSSRLPGGKLYTHKALFPVSGTYTVGDTTVTFDPARDLAVIDEHKSFFPYRTQWLWGTLGWQADGAPVGANFAFRPGVAGQEEESCIWTPSACEPLSDITFTRSASSWHISSADGRLDLVFSPEGRKDVKVQLGIVALDYYQLFGSYSGTLRSLAGTAYDVDGVHGVCESFRARLLSDRRLIRPEARVWPGRPRPSAVCASGRSARSRRDRQPRSVQ